MIADTDSKGGFALIPRALGQFRRRDWLVVLAGAAVTLVVIGIPTVIIENPFFSRMTPVRNQDYAIWVATAILVGFIAGTYGPLAGMEGKTVTSGGFLSFLAVGCPVCNKLVILLIGTSGALTFFAPLQLYLGLAAVALLAWTLWLRVNAVAGTCPAETQAAIR